MTARRRLRLGTRGSRLAVCQSEWVAARLAELDPGLEVELVRIRTTADRFTDRPLYEIGGKGLFIKEIEEALLAGTVDLGVHSMKDLPAALPAGLEVIAVPAREDPYDVLVSAGAGGIAALPHAASVGTSSLRRGALLRHARPDLRIVPLRGNVDTRIGKWRAGEVDGIVLARAGLRRLGIHLDEAEALSADECLPAIGQGALALEASPENMWADLVRGLDHPASAAAVAAERAFLEVVGGDCKTPIAAHAVVAGDAIRVRAIIADPSGSRLVRGDASGEVSRARSIGEALGRDCLERGGADILREIFREIAT